MTHENHHHKRLVRAKIMRQKITQDPSDHAQHGKEVLGIFSHRIHEQLIRKHDGRDIGHFDEAPEQDHPGHSDPKRVSPKHARNPDDRKYKNKHNQKFPSERVLE